MMRSNALRSTTRSLITGKPRARHGSSTIVSPSLKKRMCSWHTVVAAHRAVRDAVDHEAARAADALAAVVIERDRLLACADQVLVHDVEHLQKGHVLAHVVRLVRDELARRRCASRLAPDLERITVASICSSALARCTFSNVSGSLRSSGRVAVARVLPGGDVGEVLVVAQRFAVRRLALHAEMRAARFGAVQRVEAQQLGQLEEVGHAPGFFERLVELLVVAGHASRSARTRRADRGNRARARRAGWRRCAPCRSSPTSSVPSSRWNESDRALAVDRRAAAWSRGCDLVLRFAELPVRRSSRRRACRRAR